MRRAVGKNPIDEVNLEWIFACNCEGTEQLQVHLLCGVAVLREKLDPAADCKGNGCTVVRIFQN